MELVALLEVFRRKKWLLLAALVLFIVLAILASYLNFYLRIRGFDLEAVERIEYIEYQLSLIHIYCVNEKNSPSNGRY